MRKSVVALVKAVMSLNGSFAVPGWLASVLSKGVATHSMSCAAADEPATAMTVAARK